MGMKHILRALDQALETAEVERKYLRDELEAERVEDLGRGAGGHGREAAGDAQGKGAHAEHGGQPGE